MGVSLCEIPVNHRFPAKVLCNVYPTEQLFVSNWVYQVWQPVCVTMCLGECQVCHQVSLCQCGIAHQGVRYVMNCLHVMWLCTSDVKCVIVSLCAKCDIAHQRMSDVSSCVYMSMHHCPSEWQGESDCQIAPFNQNSVLWDLTHVRRNNWYVCQCVKRQKTAYFCVDNLECVMCQLSLVYLMGQEILSFCVTEKSHEFFKLSFVSGV